MSIHCSERVLRSAGPRAQPGFTLLELLVVTLIAAALLTLALPAYREQFWQTRRTLAQVELLQVKARQAQFFADHKRHAAQLSELGYPGTSYAIDAQGNRGRATSTPRIYRIGMSVVGGAYRVFAQPQQAQRDDSACGTLTLHADGRRSITGSATVAHCW